MEMAGLWPGTEMKIQWRVVKMQKREGIAAGWRPRGEVGEVGEMAGAEGDWSRGVKTVDRNTGGHSRG